jgi:DNA-binding winged helix-turn-helix (wHTH) protein
MELQSRPRRVVQFGGFKADLDSGELFKDGLKIRLPEQPFRLLAILLECPGEVVSRDELRRRLWQEDTHVDFDRSLNTAASKLREALGEAADNIETLPKRGYRFIAPVNGAPPAPGGPSEIRLLRVVAPFRRYLLWAAVLALAVLALGSAYLLWFGPISVPPITRSVRLTNDDSAKARNWSPTVPEFTSQPGRAAVVLWLKFLPQVAIPS